MAERKDRGGLKEKRRSVKQRIRDTKRLLSKVRQCESWFRLRISDDVYFTKEDLPETVRLTKERVLKCLATELEEKQQEARDKKLSKKYRMVKFFGKTTPSALIIQLLTYDTSSNI